MNLEVDARTILEWILRKWVSMRGNGLMRLRIDYQSPCVYGIELPASVNHGVEVILHLEIFENIPVLLVGFLTKIFSNSMRLFFLQASSRSSMNA